MSPRRSLLPTQFHEQPKENSLRLRLHRALREFPRYNRFLVTAHETSLTPAEAHVLVEVDSSPDCLQKELGIRLGLDKVPLSRLVQRLHDLDLIASTTSSQDRRLQSLSLTPKGKKLLQVFDTQANSRLDAFVDSAGLTPTQVRQLASFFNRLADAFEVSFSVMRPQDHLLRASIRRLTRAFGLLGKTSLGSGLALLEWQVLLTVAEHSNRFSPSGISELLAVDRTAIAVALRTLKTKRLITKKRDLNDLRSELIHCTEAGFSLIGKVETQASVDFGALSTLKESDVILVEKFIRGAAMDFFLRQRNLHFVLFSEADQLQQARRLKNQEMSGVRYTKNLPGSLFSEANSCLGLYHNDILLAAVEVKQPLSRASKNQQLINLYSSEKLHPDSVRAFILKAIDAPLDSLVALDLADYAEDLRPSATVSSTLGRLF